MIPTELQQMFEKMKRDSEKYVDERLVKLRNEMSLRDFYKSLEDIDYRLSTLERKNNLDHIANLELDYTNMNCDFPTVYNMLNNVYQRLATFEFSYKLRTLDFSLSEVISHASIIISEKDMKKNIVSLVSIEVRVTLIEEKASQTNQPVFQFKLPEHSVIKTFNVADEGLRFQVLERTFYDALRVIDSRLAVLEQKMNLYQISDLELDYLNTNCDYSIVSNIHKRLVTLEVSYKLRTAEGYYSPEFLVHALLINTNSIFSNENSMQKDINSLVPIEERITHIEKKALLISMAVNQYKPSIVLQQKPNKTIIAPKLQNDIIDDVVKKLSKEELWAANISLYGELLKQKALEYDTVLESKEEHGHIYTQYRNETLLEEQKREIIFEERKKLLQSKCSSCNRIPDNFGRCGCS